MWRRSLSCNIIPVWNKSRNKFIMPAHRANKTENKIEQLRISKCRTAIRIRFTNHILAQCFLLAYRWAPSMFECFHHREEREEKTEAGVVALGELRPHRGVMKHWGLEQPTLEGGRSTARQRPAGPPQLPSTVPHSQEIYFQPTAPQKLHSAAWFDFNQIWVAPKFINGFREDEELRRAPRRSPVLRTCTSWWPSGYSLMLCSLEIQFWCRWKGRMGAEIPTQSGGSLLPACRACGQLELAGNKHEPKSSISRSQEPDWISTIYASISGLKNRTTALCPQLPCSHIPCVLLGSVKNYQIATSFLVSLTISLYLRIRK